MRVYFVRHGESVANVEDTLSSNDPTLYPLTPHGESQVRQLESSLESVQFDAAYCSDLLRAVQTTEILLENRSLNYIVDRRLREHNMGVYEGRSDDAAWEALRELVRIWIEEGRTEVEPEEGESLDTLQARFLSFIHDLELEYGEMDASILVVAHAGLYLSTLPMLFENIDRAFVQARTLSNASLVIGLQSDGRWICEEYAGEKLGHP